MANYKFHYGLQSAYDAKKAAGSLIADHLYFTSDTLQIYKGENLLSKACEMVEAFPATGAQGRIYVHKTTMEAKVWNGTAFEVVSPAVATTLDDSTALGALITAGAVKTYVDGLVGSDGLVQDVTYDKEAQKITITYADASTKEIALENLLTGASYDAKTGDFTFTKANGESVVVNTPVENFLKSASYNKDTHVLTMTLENGTTVECNLEDLIDTYTAKATDSIDMHINGKEISADIKISSAANNVLEVKTGEEAGLYVAAPAEALVKAVENTSTVNLNVDAAGKLTAAVNVSQEAGNKVVAKDDGLFVAETDLSNYYTKAEVDAAIDAATAWEEI